MSAIEIADRKICPGHPVFVVAELSGEHRQDVSRAVALIDAAKKAGVDAVKVQVFTADDMALPNVCRVTWQGQERDLHDLYAETAMPLEWHAKLKAYADQIGLIYFASVFSREGVDFCERLGMPAYKIASFELVDLPLIRYAASKGKPVILSTGMATRAEISDAVAAAGGYGYRASAQIAALHCVSAYPAKAKDANLLRLNGLVPEWAGPTGDVVLGISDHTLGIAVPVAAVAFGARIVEKHLTLARADGGPDAAFSLEPAEFAAMVDAVRTTEQAIGGVQYGPTEAERDMLRLRRSLWVVADVGRGVAFTPANVRSLRPANGLPPACYDDVIGKRAARDCKAGEPLAWDMVER